MKVAYCINDNGEKLEVRATDEGCRKYVGKLFCPCCGEKVDPYINGKKQEKHFRHHHGSFSQECENYSTSISCGSCFQPYEREGLQLYLIKELGQYYLYLGLYGLEEAVIKEAEKINLEIQIDIEKDCINKKINSKDFIPRTIEFIKILAVKQKYNLRFIPNRAPSEIRTKWATYINGIGPNGAIFNFGKDGGKKVSSAAGLKVNEEYLLLTKSNMSNQYIKGISYQLIQELNFGYFDNYKIYKLILKEINKETLLFCEKFDLKLSYSKPEIIPIWPPCVSTEQELIYEYDGNKYFVVESGEDSEGNAYSYSLEKKLNSERINNEKNLISTCLRTIDFISLGSLRNQFIYSIIRKDFKKIDIEPNVKVSDFARKLIIDSKSKVFVNRINKQLLIKSQLIKEESIVEIDYKRNEKLEILYGLDVIWSTGEEKKEIKSDISSIDDQLLHEIYMCKGETVDIPNSFKWMVLKQKKYSRSFRELQKIIRGEKIYIELINLLRKY